MDKIIRDLVEMLREAYDSDEDAHAWFYRPQRVFDGLTPMEMLRAGRWDPTHEDVKRVFAMADRLAAAA